MALTKPRKIEALAGAGRFRLAVAAGVTIIQSGLVILAAGNARAAREGQGADNAAKAADAATYVAAGVALETVTGGAANGAVTVEVDRSRPYCFKNSAAGDAITAADIGRTAYIVDDETVAKTSPNSTRAKAGAIEDVTAEGVFVSIGKAAWA
ncbi:hypothetical protein [Brevundimonas sp.]|uniref:hypothetical protein n=1 Tax=Brevundimonas sp. TaxID=1871086 RepID=UPI003F718B70